MAGERVPPQPHPSGLTDFLNHPLVVAVVPGQPGLVGLVGLSLACAIDAPALYFAYVDTSRYAEAEYADGTVRRLAIDPDLADDTRMETEQHLPGEIAQVMSGQDVPWEFRYLGGRIDRALSHLARAVDAAAFSLSGPAWVTTGGSVTS